ncbi:MAG TPA: DUF4266 domain-containing protein [Polyangiaceae bacterium]|nr:DUF4266 domain-containing protein [Polyangiaceae bacterium]
MLISVRAPFVIFAAVAQLGCVTVKSYERGKLAHPTMQPDYAQSPARDHLRDIQEGARGGSLGVASGCGCN